VELFHRIAEPDSARARRRVQDWGLDALVQFRNVAFEKAAAALAGHGGAQTPALWDGERLWTGLAAVTERLLRVHGRAESA
jgi:hypothetical protein